MNNLRFKIYTATNVKMAVFWDAAKCSVIEISDVSEMITFSIIRAIRRWLSSCDVAACSLVEIYRHRADDGGRKHI